MYILADIEAMATFEKVIQTKKIFYIKFLMLKIIYFLNKSVKCIICRVTYNTYDNCRKSGL